MRRMERADGSFPFSASHASGAEQTLVGFLTNFYTPKICDAISTVKKTRNRTGFPKAPKKNHKTPRKKKGGAFVKLENAHECLIGEGKKE